MKDRSDDITACVKSGLQTDFSTKPVPGVETTKVVILSEAQRSRRICMATTFRALLRQASFYS
jgi:hypothetical protein